MHLEVAAVLGAAPVDVLDPAGAELIGDGREEAGGEVEVRVPGERVAAIVEGEQLGRGDGADGVGRGAHRVRREEGGLDGEERRVDVVLEGGIGTAMPANRTYFLDVSGALKFRYHPDRNFTQFGGKQSPINQDAIVQYIGFMGNLTNNNPLHEALLYDSNTSA